MKVFIFMMAIIIGLIILFSFGHAFLFAENGKHTNTGINSKGWIKEWVTETLPPTARTVKPFQKIAPNWNMKKVLLLVGMPDKIGGFGFSILTYNLQDKTQIIIGVADFKKSPVYVTHILTDGSRKQFLEKQ